MNKLVSVIVPTFNREDLIERALTSILNQTYTNIEIIVVDDSSQDHTHQIVDQFSNTKHKVIYIRNEKNLGAASSRNIGIKRSKGDYIAFLDSDDEWLDTHLEESIRILEKENAFISSAFWYERREGEEKVAFYNEKHVKEAVTELNPKIGDNYYRFDRNFFQYAITHDFYCYHINTLVIDRRVFQEVALFNSKLRASEDMDFTLRLIERYGLCLIRNYHFIYNQGNDNLYWFVERGALTPDIILQDEHLIDKLSFCNFYKSKMLILRKRLVKRTSTIEIKEPYLKKCNEKIARKYFAIAYMNKQRSVVNSLIYTLRAIKYDKQPIYLEFFATLYSKKKRKEFSTDRIDIY